MSIHADRSHGHAGREPGNDARSGPCGRDRRYATLGAALAIAALSVVAGTPALAQGTDESADACEEAARLIRDDDLDAALEEARWCLESLEQLRSDRTFALFPEDLEGYAGGQLETQGAMGMTMMNRSYSREGAGTIDVSLTSGAAGTGLAALAQMGMSLGGQGRKLRVQRRTVIDTGEADGSASYLVELRSGGMLTISSEDVASGEVLDFVKAFPIEKLDDAMKR